MSKNYTHETASLMVPFLMGICTEIAERSANARRINRSIRTLENQAGDNDGALEDLRNLRAELANQRRELRHARGELESLGCVLDHGHPQRILIPGVDGSLESGFAWDIGTEILAEITTP